MRRAVFRSRGAHTALLCRAGDTLQRRRLGRDEDRVHAGRLLTREETIARGSCDPHILAVADELLPVASSVGSSLSGLGLERVPSNVVGEAFGSC